MIEQEESCRFGKCKKPQEICNYCKNHFIRMYPYNLIEDNIIIVVYENGGYDLEPGFYQDESYTLFVIKVLPVITFMLHYKLPWNNKFSQCVIQDSVQIGGLRKMTTLDGRRTMKAIHKEVFSDSTLKTRILAMKMK